MSEKFENHEVNEKNLEQVAGGKGGGGVTYLCSNCGALVWMGYDPACAPQTTMIHCQECGRLCDGYLR